MEKVVNCYSGDVSLNLDEFTLGDCCEEFYTEENFKEIPSFQNPFNEKFSEDEF